MFSKFNPEDIYHILICDGWQRSSKLPEYVFISSQSFNYVVKNYSEYITLIDKNTLMWNNIKYRKVSLDENK